MHKGNFATYWLSRSSKPGEDISTEQKRVFEKAMPWMQSLFQGPDHTHAEENTLRDFLFPMIKMGLDFSQIQNLCLKIPSAWPLDHREIYFDFRLERWIKHIEPMTLPECLRDYIRHALSPAQAEQYIREELAKALHAEQMANMSEG